MKQNLTEEQEFILKLKRLLLKEWRKHFKNHLDNLGKEKYISAISEMLYFSMVQEDKPADLTFAYVYENIFSLITKDWEIKIQALKKKNDDAPIEDIIDIDELKTELSEFLNDVISQMNIFKSETAENTQGKIIQKFIQYINPLFSYSPSI